MRWLRSTASCLLALILLACPSKGNEGEAGETGSTCDADLDEIRAEILVPNCTNDTCHTGDMPAAGLDFSLSAEEIETQLVGIPSGVCPDQIRVIAGEPESSMLIAKLVDPPCGEQMPIDGELSEAEIACLGEWVRGVESDCETCGGAVCVNLTSDAQHCGACGNACPEGIACVAGACACPGQTELCEGACVDTGSNPQHCGSCGVACDPGAVCSNGMCVASCDPGLEQCGESCVDTLSDPLHCGGCDMPCEVGLECVDGSCSCGAEPISFSGQIAPLLDGRCTNQGCHRNPQQSAAAGLVLKANVAHASLVGVASSQCDPPRPLVDPGERGNSYLLDKLRGVNLCDGMQMPLNGTPLTPAEVQMIADWICQGAADN